MFRSLLVFLSLLALLISGCGFLVSEDGAKEAAEKQGYTEVQITASHRISPHMIGGCSREDDAAFKATAVNPAGKRVGIIICGSALFKGWTIRTE